MQEGGTAAGGGGPTGALLRWGLVPPWAKDAKVGFRMINARAETVADKPAYRDAFRGAPLPDRRRRLLRVAARRPRAPAAVPHHARATASRSRSPACGPPGATRARRRAAAQLHDRHDEPRTPSSRHPRPHAGDPRPGRRGGVARPGHAAAAAARRLLHALPDGRRTRVRSRRPSTTRAATGRSAWRRRSRSRSRRRASCSDARRRQCDVSRADWMTIGAAGGPSVEPACCSGCTPIVSATSRPCTTLPSSAYSGGSCRVLRGDDEELRARRARGLGLPTWPSRRCPCRYFELARRLLDDRVAGAARPVPCGSPPWKTKPGTIRWISVRSS